MELKFALSAGSKKPTGKKRQSSRGSQSVTSSLHINDYE